MSDYTFYFDDRYFYAVAKDARKTQYAPGDITDLSRTKNIIRKSNIWQVIVKQGDEKDIVFRFTHNYRVWDSSFAQFHEKIKQLNPSVVKSNFSLWRM